MKKRKSSFKENGAAETRLSIRSAFIAWFPPLLWSIGIFYFSSLPSFAFHLPSIRFIDKLIHAVIFGALNVLILRGCREMGATKSGLLFGMYYSILFGLSDEVHQYFVPGRSTDPLDFMADVVGVLISGWIYMEFFVSHDMEIKNAKV